MGLTALKWSSEPFGPAGEVTQSHDAPIRRELTIFDQSGKHFDKGSRRFGRRELRDANNQCRCSTLAHSPPIRPIPFNLLYRFADLQLQVLAPLQVFQNATRGGLRVHGFRFEKSENILRFGEVLRRFGEQNAQVRGPGVEQCSNVRPNLALPRLTNLGTEILQSKSRIIS